VREVLTIDDDMRAMITKGASVEAMKAAAIEKGFKTMRFAALRQWLAGATSTREVIRVTRS
jgi:general secretion pathway protein E